MQLTVRHSRRRAPQGRRGKGFTIIELMTTVAILSIVLALAVPSFTEWIRNNQVRTVSDSLQNGLRTAQAESLRRNRQVVFYLTNARVQAINGTAAANGRNWAMQTVAAFDDTNPEFIQSGTLGDVSPTTAIAGPAAICFSSNGRVVANPSGTGVSGAACAAGGATYTVTQANARTMSVRVTMGGQVRMCDPQRSAATSPDGC